MKLKLSQLRQIIKEEVTRALDEANLEMNQFNLTSELKVQNDDDDISKLPAQTKVTLLGVLPNGMISIKSPGHVEGETEKATAKDLEAAGVNVSNLPKIGY